MEIQTGGGFPDSSKCVIWEDKSVWRVGLLTVTDNCLLSWLMSWAGVQTKTEFLWWEKVENSSSLPAFKTSVSDFIKTISTVCRNSDCFQTGFHIITLLWQISCLAMHRWHTSTSKLTWYTIHNVWLWSDIFLSETGFSQLEKSRTELD